MSSSRKVMILGGYGFFGTRIARALAKENNCQVYIVGRNLHKATALAQEINAHPLQVDINKDLDSALQKIKPDVVIHTSGPFQSQTYQVVKSTIQAGCHYIDLADSRAFVQDFSQFDQAAKQNQCLAISGASSVPGLSAAVIEFWRQEFSELAHINMGICLANRTRPGIATMEGVLSYVGKPIEVWQDSEWRTVYGWQDCHTETLPGLGKRWVGNCDIPDLVLFPKYFSPVKTVRFYAGQELPLLHGGLRFLSSIVRWGLIQNLKPYSRILVKLSEYFSRFGSDCGGMYVKLSGKNTQQQSTTISWYLIARENQGPQIPCTAAILLAKKFLKDELQVRGAIPCMGLFTLPEFMNELQGYAIHSEHTLEISA